MCVSTIAFIDASHRGIVTGPQPPREEGNPDDGEDEDEERVDGEDLRHDGHTVEERLDDDLQLGDLEC